MSWLQKYLTECGLERVNRATRTSSTTAIEVLLRLPQLHLELEAEVREVIYRLCCSDNSSPNLTGTSMPKRLRA
jgi:hypothetical protein